MNFLRIPSGLVATLMLTACGGSGTSDGPSFESMSAIGNGLIEEYETTPVTDVSDMPETGRATYRGVAAYSSDYSDPAAIAQYAKTVSQLELNANFATSQISGRAYNFENVNPNITIDGQVNVSGAIDGNTFNASVSGNTVESLDGVSFDVEYRGSVEGEFVGSGADAVRGYGEAVGEVPGLAFPVWILWGAER